MTIPAHTPEPGTEKTPWNRYRKARRGVTDRGTTLLMAGPESLYPGSENGGRWAVEYCSSGEASPRFTESGAVVPVGPAGYTRAWFSCHTAEDRNAVVTAFAGEGFEVDASEDCPLVVTVVLA